MLLDYPENLYLLSLSLSSLSPSLIHTVFVALFILLLQGDTSSHITKRPGGGHYLIVHISVRKERNIPILSSTTQLSRLSTGNIR